MVANFEKCQKIKNFIIVPTSEIYIVIPWLNFPLRCLSDYHDARGLTNMHIHDIVYNSNLCRDRIHSQQILICYTTGDYSWNYKSGVKPTVLKYRQHDMHLFIYNAIILIYYLILYIMLWSNEYQISSFLNGCLLAELLIYGT